MMVLERFRLSHLFLWSIAALIVLLSLIFVHAAWMEHHNGASRKERIRLTATLGLSDLCLFTDARYTRNPATADLASPFQEHPLSLEHFPSGSLIAPKR